MDLVREIFKQKIAAFFFFWLYFEVFPEHILTPPTHHPPPTPHHPPAVLEMGRGDSIGAGKECWKERD